MGLGQLNQVAQFRCWDILSDVSSILRPSCVLSLHREGKSEGFDKSNLRGSTAHLTQ